MTRPASIRPSSSPFVRRKEKAGSKKLEIDWDKVEDSYNHRLNLQLNHRTLKRLRQELIEAEALGRPKAKKIRREINQLLEQNLALGATWCRGCLNYLHNCKCKMMREGPHPNTLRARARREERALNRIEQVRLELLAKIANVR